MDIGLPQQDPDPPDPVSSPFTVWFRDALDQVCRARQFNDRRDYMIKERFDACLLLVTGLCIITLQRKSLNWTRFGWVHLWWCQSSAGRWASRNIWTLLIHCQDVKKVPQPSRVKSWITTPWPVDAPLIPVLGANTVAHASQGSPSVDVLPPDKGVVLTPIFATTQVGCGPYSANDNCPCFQLLYGCPVRWC